MRLREAVAKVPCRGCGSRLGASLAAGEESTQRAATHLAHRERAPRRVVVAPGGCVAGGRAHEREEVVANSTTIAHLRRGLLQCSPLVVSAKLLLQPVDRPRASRAMLQASGVNRLALPQHLPHSSLTEVVKAGNRARDQRWRVTTRHSRLLSALDTCAACAKFRQLGASPGALLCTVHARRGVLPHRQPVSNCSAHLRDASKAHALRGGRLENVVVVP